jgi:hypothetical protein
VCARVEDPLDFQGSCHQAVSTPRSSFATLLPKAPQQANHFKARTL